MALWWSGIDVKVEVAFSTDPLATTPTWTDVTAFVRRDGFRVFRGKTSEDGSIAPGTATIVLANRDRRFDPDYASSPYNPNVKPMRRIRITATQSSTTYTVFTGFVTSWRNDWTIEDGVSIVQCVDSTWWAANEPLPPSAHAQAVLSFAPALYYSFQDPEFIDDLGPRGLDAASVDSPIAGGLATVDLGNPVGASIALSSTDEDLFAGVGRTFAIADAFEPRAVSFWFSGPLTYVSYRAQARSGLDVYVRDSEIFIEYSHDTDGRSQTSFGGFATGVRVDPTSRHVVVSCDSTNALVYVNGQLRATIALLLVDASLFGDTYNFLATFDNQSTLSHISYYDTTLDSGEVQELWESGFHAYGHPRGEMSGGRINRVLDSSGWPSALRSIDAGRTMQGAYLPAGMRAVEYLRLVAESERGVLFVDVLGRISFRDRVSLVAADSGFTFSDDGATGSIKYDELELDGSTVDTVRNIVTVSYSTVGGITRRDTASITAYGASQLFIDGPTIPNARTASNLAAFELAQRKDPRTRVTSIRSVVRNRTTTANQLEKLLSLELGDIVGVEITPLGVTPQVVKRCIVQGIEHEVDAEQWSVRLYMSPAPTETGWFTVGTSSLGGTDVLLP